MSVTSVRLPPEVEEKLAVVAERARRTKSWLIGGGPQRREHKEESTKKVVYLRYTGETWGEAQLLIYRDKLNEALQTLRRDPLIGHRARSCRTRIGSI